MQDRSRSTIPVARCYQLRPAPLLTSFEGGGEELIFSQSMMLASFTKPRNVAASLS